MYVKKNLQIEGGKHACVCVCVFPLHSELIRLDGEAAATVR